MIDNVYKEYSTTTTTKIIWNMKWIKKEKEEKLIKQTLYVFIFLGFRFVFVLLLVFLTRFFFVVWMVGVSQYKQTKQKKKMKWNDVE